MSFIANTHTHLAVAFTVSCQQSRESLTLNIFLRGYIASIASCESYNKRLAALVADLLKVLMEEC